MAEPKINWTEPPVVPAELPGYLKPGRPDLAIPKPVPLTEAELQAVREAADRKRELDHTEAVARGTAIAAVNGVLEEQRRAVQASQEEEKRKLAPFYSYLDSLRELAEESQDEARTELKLQLFRLEGSRGPQCKKIYCLELTMDQAEVKAMGDPGFEARTQEYAERAGRFGRYEWRMKGWAAGELTLDTSVTVNVEPPPGYVPPANPIIEEKPKVDPMEGMNGALDMVGRVASLFGGGKGGMDPVELRKLESMAYDQGQRAGLTEGRYQAEREHRKELDDLRERHRRDLEEAERRGLERGKIEGAREVRDELTPRIWQLEHQVASEGGPSIASEVVGYLGGPEAVQALVGAVVANLNKPKAPGGAQPAVRPAPPAAGPGQSAQPQARPAVPNPSGEPTRAEHLEAMGMIEETMAVLEEAIPNEAPEHAAQLNELKALLEAFHSEGLKDGPLRPWWAEWNGRWKPNVEAVLNAAEEHASEAAAPVEETVNLEALRAVLIEALDEGKEDAAILAYLESTISADIRAGWRRQIEGWPTAMVAGVIGQGRHQERLASLLEAFRSGN